MPYKPFNCTVEELKHNNYCGFQADSGTFNCTVEELKLYQAGHFSSFGSHF